MVLFSSMQGNMEKHRLFEGVLKEIVYYCLFISFLVNLCSSSIFVTRICDKNSDCLEDECCLQRPFSTTFYCAKRVSEGKVCWRGLHNATADSDKFRIICPCERNLECRYHKTLSKPIFAVAKCRIRITDEEEDTSKKRRK